MTAIIDGVTVIGTVDEINDLINRRNGAKTTATSGYAEVLKSTTVPVWKYDPDLTTTPAWKHDPDSTTTKGAVTYTTSCSCGGKCKDE